MQHPAIDFDKFDAKPDQRTMVGRVIVCPSGEIISGHTRYTVWREMRNAPPLPITLIDDAGRCISLTLTRKEEPCVP